jgi:hypothetical protein
MVSVVRDRSSVCGLWRNRACDHRTDAAWKRLRRNPGEKARGEFEDVTRGSRQGVDHLWLGRQKQGCRSYPNRPRHGINSYRTGAAKAGAGRSNRYFGGATNSSRSSESCSGRFSETWRRATVTAGYCARCIACTARSGGLQSAASRTSSRRAFTSRTRFSRASITQPRPEPMNASTRK